MNKANMYDKHNGLYWNMPSDMADPESFYTPELQEQVLQQLTQQAENNRAQNQASISGNAVRSGFGVGGTSREAARRAKADSQALDEVISGSIQQAAAIEDMRRTQNEDAQSRRFQAEEGRKDNQQSFDLAKQGYQASFDAQQRQISDESRNARQDALLGGITNIGIGAADLIGQSNLFQQKPVAPTSPNQQNPVWYDPSQYRG